MNNLLGNTWLLSRFSRKLPKPAGVTGMRDLGRACDEAGFTLDAEVGRLVFKCHVGRLGELC